MKISKPKENQILIEDEYLKDFDLEVKNKTGLKDSKYNKEYETLLLLYRFPDMEASKQIIYGNTMSIWTIVCSFLENLLLNDVISEKLLKEMPKTILKKMRREK